MPGLNLMGGVEAKAQARAGNTPAPTTASEAAWGTANAPSRGAAAALAPTHPAGIVMWLGVACVIGLVVVYNSLPR